MQNQACLEEPTRLAFYLLHYVLHPFESTVALHCQFCQIATGLGSCPDHPALEPLQLLQHHLLLLTDVPVLILALPEMHCKLVL